MTPLTRVSLANRSLVALVTLAIVVFGSLAALALRQELLPSISAPTAVVTAVYPGSSPEIVANDVAEPVEEALGGVQGVTQVRSVSAQGIATFVVEWEYGLDDEETVAALRTAADSVQDLPDDTEISVQAGSTDDIPVLALAVASDAPIGELAAQVEDVVVPRLAKIEGVREVQVSGQNTTELDVTLKPAELREYDLTAQLVTQAIQSQATVVPAGTGYERDTELAVQVGSTAGSARQVGAWPIPTADGPVALRDLATVKVASVESTTLARADARPALSVTVLKERNADAVEISAAVEEQLPGLRDSLGQGATFSTAFDQAPLIEQSIHDLAVEGALGLGMAVLVILVFLLSVRPTVITAISIPLSLLIALIGLQVGDYSLNIFTLAALTVAVGRVVDDSIVVTENIKRRAVPGVPLTPAAIVASVREVAGAVVASTLTTVAVFLPVAIVSGVTGELFRPFSVTVAVALAASLLVSLTIVPVLAYWFLQPRRRSRSATPGRAESEDDRRVTRLQRGYLPVLGFGLRHPVVTLVVAVVVFAATMGSATLLRTDFLGSVADKTSLQITQAMPAGTRLSATSEAAAQVEEVLRSHPEVASYLTTVGQGGANNAAITAVVTDEDRWEALRGDLERELQARPELGEIQVAAVNTSGATSDIEVTVTGDDEQDLRTTAERVQQTLAGTPGLRDVSSDLAEERPVLQVQVDLREAAERGMTSAEIGQAIAAILRGTQAGTVVLEGESRDIMVRSQRTDATPDEIADLELPVTQLQTQQAQQRATDRLTDKQEAAAEEQREEAEAQAVEQRQALVDQRAETQRALAESREQLARLRADPPAVPPAPSGAPGAALPTQLPTSLPVPTAVPTTEAQVREAAASARAAATAAASAARRLAEAQAAAAAQQQAAQAQLAAQVAQQQWAQQVGQLSAAVTQANAGLEQIDEQLAALDEQTTAAEEQAAEQEDLAEEQQAITDVRARPAKVSDVAKVTQVLAPATETHVDGVRTVTVSGTPDAEDLGALTAEVQTRIDGLADVPAGVDIAQGGAQEEQQEAFAQLGLAMLLAIVLVFLIMVATFRSLVQPLILLVSIPFAATGAVAALLLTDTALGVPAMVGLLMLIGIVVTNAIVLIDLINQYRAQGEDLQTAITDGARLRLRPIIMTACATIFALIPMGLGLTGGGAFISRPLAVVVIGGLVSSTILTLLLVPVLYSLVERRNERRRQQAQAQETEPVPVP